MTANLPHNILLAGRWQAARCASTFSAYDPSTGESLGDVYPISDWHDVDAALYAAADAFTQMQQLPPAACANFLRRYADLIEQRTDEIVAMAARETGLPVEPRLKSVELARTLKQLRLAADAATDPSWRLPTIDREANIRSLLEPIGPVIVFGPNNFPLAYNGICGGDFASAIAAGNPVIAKAHPLHPTTTRLLAELAAKALAPDLPPAAVQLLYGVDEKVGLRMVADPRLGAVGFTGSRTAGTALKRAADEVGKPIFLEMSSINPVIFLPGALAERPAAVLDEAATSALMAAGQFCTNPGLMMTIASQATDDFVRGLAERYAAAPPATLLGQGVQRGLAAGVERLVGAGATLVEGGKIAERAGFAFANTLLKITASQFLGDPATFQSEVFGNCTLLVVADSVAEIAEIIGHLEGNLTGSIYSAQDGSDDADYQRLAPLLAAKVGRLLNDKMTTGVAVSPAMNHGGPFPATGHPHFTAVGIPASLRRFTRLVCYDNVRAQRLPQMLRD